MFSSKIADFDDKDITILRMIAASARRSLVDISEESEISMSNVNHRIKKMIKNGIIKDFKVILDLGKIGYYWYKIEMQLNDLHIKKDMIEYFHQHPDIVYAYETISDNDLEVEMEVTSYEKFREVLDGIRNHFGKNVKKYFHFLWYKEHKFTFMP